MTKNPAVLLSLGALVGCVHPADAGPGPHAWADGDVDASLARLEALDVFEVGALIVDLPHEAFSCYGPCPGSEQAIADAERRAADRLFELTEAAERAAAGPRRDHACGAQVVADNLQALRSLEIVEVGALIVQEPESDPACYNMPCQADIDAAERVTCERASALARIVDAAGALE